MLIGLMTTLLVILGFIMIPLILIQKGKGGMGLGSLGGANQMLFGGSGGQDLFQKITWGMGAVFMCLTLGLSILKTSNQYKAKYVKGGSTLSETHKAESHDR